MTIADSITIAVPTFNGARHLAETLRSLQQAQAPPQAPLLICDDRSEDASLDIVREECGDRARVLMNSERLGLAGNWNRCVTAAGTPWVTIVHQDDLWRPGHLAAHRAVLVARGSDDLGLICGAAEVIDDAGQAVPASVVGRDHLGPADRFFAAGEFVAELAVSNPVRCSAVTLRAEAHAEAGGFDPAFRYAVDWDFWLRVAERRPVAWLARPTVAIRWHPRSETHRFKSGLTDLEEQERLLAGLFSRHAAMLPWPDRLRRSADRRLARGYLNRAHDALHAGQADLARRSLARAFRLSPAALASAFLDPRLAVQMALLAVAPGLVRRLFAANDPSTTLEGRERIS